ncbi:methyltransferase domain-containing protein [Serratia proteamaculans]
MKSFTEKIYHEFVWLPEIGMGHFPVMPDTRPYDAAYFAKYQAMSDTDVGRELTAARIQLVARHYTGSLLDVGIGAGKFVESRQNTCGYDVNPVGIEWLECRGLWADLYAGHHQALSFWDSLEHIDNPDIAVACAGRWVFVSVPVFDSGDHVLRSKHFKKTEHIWYWTHDGLVSWFAEQGFELAEHNTCESLLGREDIGSYAFRRL